MARVRTVHLGCGPPYVDNRGREATASIEKFFLQWRIPYNVIKNVETWFISMKLNELSISQLLKIFRFPQKNVMILCANSTKRREVAQKPELEIGVCIQGVPDLCIGFVNFLV